jgi:D-threonate/D-erythronate kinase
MIAVIADDFSGAAEIAGLAYRFGLRVEVQAERFIPCRADVIVVDANTRSLPEGAAAARVAALTRSIAAASPDWVYKKIDSVLRGPVVAETVAMLAAAEPALGWRRGLLINSNPRRGRLVRGGQLRIHGAPVNETPFAHDPEYPRWTADVRALLQPSESNLPSSAAPEYSADHAWHAASLPAHTPTAAGLGTGWCVQVLAPDAAGDFDGLAIAEIETERHLLHWAERVLSDTLLGGGVEFFEALLRRRGAASHTKRPATLHVARPALFAVGSASSWGERQALFTPLDISVVELCPARPGHHGPPASLPASLPQIEHEAVQRVRALLELGGRGALTLSLAPLPASVAEQALDALVKTTAAVVDQLAGGQLFVEGGRTASLLIRQCGWTRMRVCGDYGDGVVGLQPAAAAAVTPAEIATPAEILRTENTLADSCRQASPLHGEANPSALQSARGLQVIVKPGSYRWPIDIGHSSPDSRAGSPG